MPSEELLLLAIDDESLPLRHSLYLHLSKPTVRAEPVLVPADKDSDAPDNLAAHFYGTVLHDEGKFRMWYYACHWQVNLDWDAHHARQTAKWHLPFFQGPLCYAESEDGLHWHKPQLGQLLFKGSSANNALALPHTLVSCATVIKDADDPDPQRRYKMAYEFFPEFSEPPLEGGRIPMPTCALATSPDGLCWEVSQIPYPAEFIEHSSFYKHDSKYIINSQQIDMQMPGEGGTPRGRQGFVHLSPDFDHWVDGAVESFCLPEPADPGARGISGKYDQVHLGVGAASFGNVCVGLYGIWHNDHFNDSFNRISCDLGLLVSNDGLRFREPVKGHVFLSKAQSSAPPVEGKNYNTNLCQANGILNVGDETRIYHGRWRNSGDKPGDIENYYAEVALATLPRDRWGALRLAPHRGDGAVWTRPLQMPQNAQLVLNAEGVAGIRVEIGDANFKLHPEFSGGHAGGATGEGGLDCAVSWGTGDLSRLAGQTVRFKINFQAGEHDSPSLFAATLKSAI